ncbi:MAG: ABC transporter substrate-binding protein [Chloroflexia bacterium]|nr:ABC transporter substrate-binding protein [Chloroflexia bacterium]
MATRAWSRRNVVKAGGALVSGLGVGSLGYGGRSARAARQATPTPIELTSVPDALKGSGEVVLASFGGAVLDAQLAAFIEPYERLTGISVTVADGPDPSKVRAMVDTGNVEWDVVQLGRGDILLLDGYWEPMDYALFDTANIDENLRGPDSFAMVLFAQILAYRTDAFPEAPRGWQDFWDTEDFPGPRTMVGGTSLPFLEAALIADGVPVADVYPIDIDRAYASLDRIKPSVVVWWEAGAQPAQMLTDNEVPLAVAFNGRIATIQREGAPVAIQWNEGMLAQDDWAIVKGAPNKENALKFCAFCTLPEPQARFSTLIPYGFVNNAAADLIPADILAQLPTAPAQKDKIFLRDERWWADNRDVVLERWNEWVLE